VERDCGAGRWWCSTSLRRKKGVAQAGWAMWATEARWPARLTGSKARGNSFRNKIEIFEFAKALGIYTRRFRRDFDVRIFPKFS
jgi:hypothetical protein